MKKTKVLSVLLALFSISAVNNFTSFSDTTNEILIGDLNADNILTFSDVIMMKQNLLGTIKLNSEQFINSDINKDKNSDILDTIILNNELLNAPKNLITAPSFSVKSGFYDEAFDLELNSNDAGVRIFYTLDGSSPNNKSYEYKEKINIKDPSNEENVYASIKGTSPYDINVEHKVTKCKVIRAVAIDKYGNKSNIMNSTYFIGSEIKNKYKNTAVISLITDPENLFDYETGIYVQGKVFDEWVENGGNPNAEEKWEFPGNYSQKGDEWEKPVHIEFFENNKILGFNQNMGLRISGNATRTSMQKSFKLYSREEYGTKEIKYDLIPGNTKEGDKTQPLKEYKRFLLRNGGNDGEYTKMRDSFIQNIINDRAFATQSYRPTVVFLDGEYWGVYNIREEFNDDYVKNNYGIPKDDVIMMQMSELEEGIPGDEALYFDMLYWVRNNDISKTENYNKLCNMIDIDSFIDFYCSEIYVGNEDWMNNANNFRLWRSRSITNNPYQDGKWRWMMFDTDMSMGLYKKGIHTHDTLKPALEPTSWGADDHIVLLTNLIKNEEFKRKFVTTFMDLANENFKYENAYKKLSSMASLYRPLMQEQYQRFGPDWVKTWYGPTEVDFFDQEVEYVRLFLQNRGAFVPSMMTKHLNLSGKTAKVELKKNDINGGDVLINTIKPTFNSDKWVGNYFIDYPVKVTATPKSGYKFIGWQGASESTDPTIEIEFSKDISLTAVFEKIIN